MIKQRSGGKSRVFLNLDKKYINRGIYAINVLHNEIVFCKKQCL